MKNLDFGKKLIEIRTLKGLTQSEVADKCNVTTRTIQRIESGSVNPRAATIKIISKTLEFDFFKTSDTGYDVKDKNQPSKLEYHTILWYIKDLFNLKTNTMKKISILSVSTFLLIFMFTSIFNAKAQYDFPQKEESLQIQLNDDQTVKRVEVAFGRSLTLDSLVQIKNELHELGITIHYKKIEFDLYNSLLNLECEVISNDGFSGSFGTGNLSERRRNERIGFYRDYTADSSSPFGTGLLDQ
ncbi:MAG TPA: helix-turn-helix transcriptional regulator [Draconibacterium sp.]|nr:helix-turn-helix transcriptional regulator [Draconibacterium sp.]